MPIHTATPLSAPHAYMVSLFLLAIRGVQYSAVAAAAAAVTPGNRSTPIRAISNPEIYAGVATPAGNVGNNLNLERICIALCRAGLGGLPCEPYRCTELLNANVKYTEDVPSDKKRSKIEERYFEDRVQIIFTYNHHNDYPTHLERPLTNEASPRNMVPSVPSNATPRRKVCMKLCEYNLGFPLCDCDQREEYLPMDSECICAVFCTGYDYQLDGCPACVDEVWDGPHANGFDEDRHHFNKAHGSVCRLNSTLTPEAQPGSAPTDRRQIDWNQWCKERCAEGDGGAACNCDILPLNFKV